MRQLHVCCSPQSWNRSNEAENLQEMCWLGCGASDDVNCSYFKHFTSGENAEILQVTTQKGKCECPESRG
ncbi:hypothetical protein GDO81_025953 [Engystomops pustulosus]|uniref:Uncharacterized protein n=1 Tax=Engystomops pustulosus TaxID=76066 RepID=A0AAV6YHR3_ENGPU|nr:hypothetical protein GDO81_025953 [Engystomops pustulosus]